MPRVGDSRAVTMVEREGRRVAALVHDPAVSDDESLVRAVAAAAGCSWRTSACRQTAVFTARGGTGLRARIVAATQDERRRIERDLHDGTQQRLVSIAMTLGLADAKVATDAEAARRLIAEARDGLSSALQELRELSQGIHPGILTERGLGQAVDELVLRMHLPVQVDVRLSERLPTPVETAAYYVISEALTNIAKHAGASSAQVTVGLEGGRAVIAISDDGRGGATPAADPDCGGLPIASRRSGAGSGSTARSERVRHQGRGPMRVVVADDSVLLREGLVRLLTEAGFEVAGQAGDAEELMAAVGAERPDVAIVDIRMPPTHTDEGLRARELRVRYPTMGVLVLSQYVRPSYAVELLQDGAERVGYLLKDRVSDVGQLTESPPGGGGRDGARSVGRRAARGPTPRRVRTRLGAHRTRAGGPRLMAEGRSNRAVAERLFITEHTVEKHVQNIFSKLEIPATTTITVVYLLSLPSSTPTSRSDILRVSGWFRCSGCPTITTLIIHRTRRRDELPVDRTDQIRRLRGHPHAALRRPPRHRPLPRPLRRDVCGDDGRDALFGMPLRALQGALLGPASVGIPELRAGMATAMTVAMVIWMRFRRHRRAPRPRWRRRWSSRRWRSSRCCGRASSRAACWSGWATS